METTNSQPTDKPVEQENALAGKLLDVIEAGEKKWGDTWKQIRRDKRYATGRVGDEEMTDEKSKLVRANLIFSTIQGLLPYLYAKNPEISVAAKEQVGAAGYTWLKPFCKTLEICVNTQLKDARLKQVGKATVRGALTSRIGYIKAVYQRDYKTDPVIRSRIEDAQDNIARLNAVIKQVAEDQDTGDMDAQRQELEQLVSSLEQRVEVVAAEGMTLDYIQSTNMILDSAIPDFDGYIRGRHITQKIWMSLEEARQKTGALLDGARLFGSSADDDGLDQRDEIGGGDTQPKDPMVMLYEMWHKPTMTVYTLAKGEKNFVRDPYQPTRLGERWYPFFALGFFQVDGESYPMSLIELLRELVDEYNESRTQLKEHRRISVPHWITSDETDENDIKSYQHAELGEIVIVATNGKPLREVFDVAQTPPLNPVLYDTQQVLSEIEMLSGLQDANRGTVSKAKTAREAEILQSGVAGRTDEMRDTEEDVFSELGQYTAEILLQELSVPQVMRVAGEGAVWPTYSKDEVFDLVNIVTRAGSTGKPNKLQDQERWLKLMPLIESAIDKIMQLQAQGVDAQPYIKLLKESVRRFDEKIDIDELLPQQQQQPALPPGLPTGAPGQQPQQPQQQDNIPFSSPMEQLSNA